MKFIALVFISVVLFSVSKLHRESKDSHLTVYILNFNGTIDGGISPLSFWHQSEIDTVAFKGDSLIAFFKRKTESLTDTVLYESWQTDLLETYFVFVFKINNINDTLYADRNLRYFERTKNKKRYYYIDKTGFFKKIFEDFVVYEN